MAAKVDFAVDVDFMPIASTAGIQGGDYVEWLSLGLSEKLVGQVEQAAHHELRVGIYDEVLPKNEYLKRNCSRSITRTHCCRI